MRVSRVAWLAFAATVLSGTAAFGDVGASQACPVIGKVVAAPFQLTQVTRKDISDCQSRSYYTGATVLTLSGCTTPTSVVTVPVNVELRTTTLLNKCGDGLTDGKLTLTAPSTGQVISGTLTAINENFGELTGIVIGRLTSGTGLRIGLRAVFHGVFVKDSSGNFTLVNVDAHGVTTTRALNTGEDEGDND